MGRARVRARELRRSLTEEEAILWVQLRLLKPHGFHFRKQVPLAGYIADFACHRAKMIVELDGGQHSESERQARDRLRDARLAEHGYKTLRFQNWEVRRELQGVVTAIMRVAEERTSPTHHASHGPPSRQAGGKR